MGRQSTFNSIEDKEKIKVLLDDGFSIKFIAETLGVAFRTVHKEVVNGLTEEEKRNRQYVKYNIRRAVLNDLNNRYGSKVFDVLEVSLDD